MTAVMTSKVYSYRMSDQAPDNLLEGHRLECLSNTNIFVFFFSFYDFVSFLPLFIAGHWARFEILLFDYLMRFPRFKMHFNSSKLWS